MSDTVPETAVPLSRLARYEVRVGTKRDPKSLRELGQRRRLAAEPVRLRDLQLGTHCRRICGSYIEVCVAVTADLKAHGNQR
jgi:hypothetical protein